jgi:hypothetical protein
MHPSLTPAFYQHLEWQLSGALRLVPDRSLHRYWCDGILDPEWAEDYQPEYVRRSRQLGLRAWLDEGPSKGSGTSAQAIWRLILRLGPRSYPAYLQGRSLKCCVPAAEAPGWVWLDAEKQLVEVQLL